jgi:hypothetical protein
MAATSSRRSPRGSGSRFRPGETTYVCDCCGRRTRYTGVQAVSSRTCPQCWDLAGLENSVMDGTDPVEVTEERDRLVAEAVARGGDHDRIVKIFNELWKR